MMSSVGTIANRRPLEGRVAVVAGSTIGYNDSMHARQMMPPVILFIFFITIVYLLLKDRVVHRASPGAGRG